MAVESAADLAAFFDVDEFAESAAYTAPTGGDAVPCSVIVDRGQGRRSFRAPEDFGSHETRTSERNLTVRCTAPGLGGLSAVLRDGRFAMLDADGVPTGEVFRATGLPALDETARIWSVQLLLVD